MRLGSVRGFCVEMEVWIGGAGARKLDALQVRDLRGVMEVWMGSKLLAAALGEMEVVRCLVLAKEYHALDGLVGLTERAERWGQQALVRPREEVVGTAPGERMRAVERVV